MYLFLSWLKGKGIVFILPNFFQTFSKILLEVSISFFNLCGINNEQGLPQLVAIELRIYGSEIFK